MRRFGLLFLLATASPLSAASPDPADLAVSPEIQTKARQLVQELGSEKFADREAAQEELEAMGRFAFRALLDGANNDPNPEVRHRCSELLPAATALDMKARIDTFLADVEGRYEHDLPGWNEFRATVRGEWSVFGYAIAGDRSLDRHARRVFAELLGSTENRWVLMAVTRPADEFRRLVAARRQELYDRRNRMVDGVRAGPDLEDMTTLLFAESLTPSAIPVGPRTLSISTLISSSGFTTAARRDDDTARVYRAVAAAWLGTRLEPREMYYAMTIATNLDLPDEVCRLSVRLLTEKAATSSYRGRAAINLVNHGDKRHVPLLEKARADTFATYTVRITTVKDGKSEAAAYEVQVRDMALAVSLLLTGQELDDYGFSDRYANNPSYTNRAYSYTRYYFADAAARKAAFAKWEKWRKANPEK
jgi:hypothetical protein